MLKEYLGTNTLAYDQTTHFQTPFGFFPFNLSKKCIEEWLSKPYSILS